MGPDTDPDPEHIHGDIAPPDAVYCVRCAVNQIVFRDYQKPYLGRIQSRIQHRLPGFSHSEILDICQELDFTMVWDPHHSGEYWASPFPKAEQELDTIWDYIHSHIPQRRKTLSL